MHTVGMLACFLLNYIPLVMRDTLVPIGRSRGETDSLAFTMALFHGLERVKSSVQLNIGLGCHVE